MAAKDLRQERAARKRSQILDAARTLFVSSGYAATSMDAVVAKAGVSKQTLYRYFPSKTDLLVSVLADEFSFAQAAQTQTSPPHTLDDVRDALLLMARTLTARLMMPEYIEFFRLVLGEAIRVPEARRTLRQSGPSQLLASAEAILRAGDAARLIHVPRPDLSARMFVGPVFSFVALDGLLSTTPPTRPSEDELAAIVDAFLLTVRADG